VAAARPGRHDPAGNDIARAADDRSDDLEADVLGRLLDGTTRGARRAAVVAVAMAVGVLLGASALAGHPTRVVSVADGSSAAPVGSEQATGHGSGTASKAPKESKSGKPEKTAAGSDESDETAKDEGDGGVHGKCVSAVARDKDKVGGPHDNHGFAVSRAAHTCPNPQPEGTAGD
jgi:hypothetical protein